MHAGLKGVRRKRVRWIGGPPVLPCDRSTSSQHKACPSESRAWDELPQELLVKVLERLGDEKGVLQASAVCHAWREGLSEGVTELSLKW